MIELNIKKTRCGDSEMKKREASDRILVRERVEKAMKRVCVRSGCSGKRHKENCSWKEQGVKLITEDDPKILNVRHDLDSRGVGDLANRLVIL